MNKESGHIVETAVEARAGFLDRETKEELTPRDDACGRCPTTVVLIVSTALTIAIFAAIYISFFAW
jgi:hypothetical protein